MSKPSSAFSNCTGHVEQFVLEETAQTPSTFSQYQEAVYFNFTRENPAPPVDSAPPLEEGVDTKLSVVERDCVDVGIDLARVYGGARVGVLNMANEWNCGGGFERVDGSQEEYLFRRTSCAVSLWPHRRQGDERWTKGCKLLGRAEQSFYQFSEAGGVLTPVAAVISDASLRYTDRATRVSAAKESEYPHLGILSIAAQDLRPRHYNKGVHFDSELTKEKLRTALHMALKAGHKALVLGAIGCGAFRNPPKVVAAIFMELLKGEFRNQFVEVQFAVVFSQSNLAAFQEVVGAAEKSK